MLSAAALAAALLAAVVVAAGRLARAGWPARAPSHALVLWQGLGLAGGLLALTVTGTLALLPFGATELQAGRAVVTARSAPWWSLLAAAVTLALFLRLLSVLVASTLRTLRGRRRHRELLDLVATRNPLLARARVVDHAVPVAYCLPGLRSRLVLSRGAVALLHDDELRAVLAHESAHLTQRHDLVVLPFVALGATFPRLPVVRTARAEVAQLIELLADDQAARGRSRTTLARALGKVGAGQLPPDGLGSGAEPTPAPPDGEVLRRVQRLLRPPPPLGPGARAAAVGACALVLLLPLLPPALAVVLAG